MAAPSPQAFHDELPKLGVDVGSLAEMMNVGPEGLIGGVAAGKVALNNILSRHGHKVRPLRWLGGKTLGASARLGAKGKGGLSSVPGKAIKEVAGAIEPHLVGTYESGHRLGSWMGDAGVDPGKAFGAASKVLKSGDTVSLGGMNVPNLPGKALEALMPSGMTRDQMTHYLDVASRPVVPKMPQSSHSKMRQALKAPEFQVHQGLGDAVRGARRDIRSAYAPT